MAKFFAAVNVADMHLDDRKPDGCDSVADRDRRVRVGGWVYDDAVKFAEALLDFIDELRPRNCSEKTRSLYRFARQKASSARGISSIFIEP